MPIPCPPAYAPYDGQAGAGTASADVVDFIGGDVTGDAAKSAGAAESEGAAASSAVPRTMTLREAGAFAATSFAVRGQAAWRGYAVRMRAPLDAEARLRAMRPSTAHSLRQHLRAILAEQGLTLEEAEFESNVREAVARSLRERRRLQHLAARWRADGSFR